LRLILYAFDNIFALYLVTMILFLLLLLLCFLSFNFKLIPHIRSLLLLFYLLFTGGLVVFECPIVKSLKPIYLLDEGKIKRIRGIAYLILTRILIFTLILILQSNIQSLSVYIYVCVESSQSKTRNVTSFNWCVCYCFRSVDQIFNARIPSI
jgi:hypothetical protein